MAGAPPTHMRSRRSGLRLRGDPTPSGTAPLDGGLHVPECRARGKSRQDYSGSSIFRGRYRWPRKSANVGCSLSQICRLQRLLATRHRQQHAGPRLGLAGELRHRAVALVQSSGVPSGHSSNSVLKGERSQLNRQRHQGRYRIPNCASGLVRESYPAPTTQPLNPTSPYRRDQVR